MLTEAELQQIFDYFKARGTDYDPHLDFTDASPEDLHKINIPALDERSADKAVKAGNFSVGMLRDKVVKSLGESDLVLDIDNPIFRVDGNGTPLPPKQTAVVRAIRRNITQPTHWTVPNRTIPDGTEQIEVSIDELTSEGVKLTNIMNRNTDSWFTDGYYRPIDSVSLIAGHKYYTRLTAKAVKSTANVQKYTILEISKADDDSIVYINISGEKSDEEQKGSGIFNITETNTGKMYSWAFPEVALRVKEAIVIDITELSKEYPQYTDEQLKKILDDSLPYISAQQSKTVGGVCHLENLSLANKINSSDGFGISNNKGYSFDFSSDKQWVYCLIDGWHSGDCIFQSLTIKANGKGYTFPVRYSSDGRNGYYVKEQVTDGVSVKTGYSILKHESMDTSVLMMYYNGQNNGAVVNMECLNSMILNITPCLLDLWLSLEGYDSWEKKAEWCNAHIPHFEKSYDLVLNVTANSLPIKVTAGQHTATSAINVVENIVTALSENKDIVESGDKYIKFRDGTAMCLYQYYGTFDFSQGGIELGNVKKLDVSVNFNYPFAFKETPVITATMKGQSTYGNIARIDYNTTQLTSFGLISYTPVTFGNTINFFIIGKWK